METKTILITGLDAGLTEAGIRSWLNRFGPVTKVRVIRKGIYDDSSALVEMGISDEAAADLVSRLRNNYWRYGVNANLFIS